MSDKSNTPHWPDDDLPGRQPDAEALGRAVRARAAGLPQPEAGEASWDWATRFLVDQRQTRVIAFRDQIARRRRLRPEQTATVFGDLRRLAAHAPSDRIDLPRPSALSSHHAAIDVSFRVDLQVRSGAEGIARVRDREFALVFGELKTGVTTDAPLRFDGDGHAALRLPDTAEVRALLAAGPYTLIAFG